MVLEFIWLSAKAQMYPDSQIEDVVLQLPMNYHPIKPFDIKVFEKV